MVHVVPEGKGSPGGHSDTTQIAQLTAELSAVRQELDDTHAHYQKLLERSGGMHDFGPIERQDVSGTTTTKQKSKQGLQQPLAEDVVARKASGGATDPSTAAGDVYGNQLNVKVELDTQGPAAQPPSPVVSGCVARQLSTHNPPHLARGSESGYGGSLGSLAALTQENKCGPWRW
jgi:hypothetical protein